MNDSFSLSEAIANILIFIVALWLIASRVFLPMRGLMQTDNFIAGIAIALLSLSRLLLRPSVAVYLALISGVIGIWLIFSPFIMQYRVDTSVLINNIATGILVLILSLIDAWIQKPSNRLFTIFRKNRGTY